MKEFEHLSAAKRRNQLEGKMEENREEKRGGEGENKLS